jgi:UDP-GlcNAc:undecaprenyl-phosphate GlcNAc-1-phosphate transferase
MSIITLIASAVAAGLLSFAITPLTIALAHRIGAIDHPSERKVHGTPIPRLGGMAVILAAAAILSAAFYFSPRGQERVETGSFWLAVALGLLPIVLASFADDIRSLRPVFKLGAHATGALIAVALGIKLGPVVHIFGNTVSIGWLAIPISILWIVGLTNAFNLVDGLDGLSAGLALISAISLGAVSIVAHKPSMAIASFVVAGALLGFLPFNIYPARVFLGDAGATAAGFTLACLALGGGSTLSAGMAILVPVLVLGLPIADTLVTIARRYLRARAGLFVADRDHIHHRLLTLGLHHKQAVYVLYGAGLIGAVCGVASMFMTYGDAAVLLFGLLIAAFVGVHKLGYDEFAFVRRGAVLKPYEVPAFRSTFFAAFIDVMFVVGALYAAFILKYDDWRMVAHRDLARQLLPLVVAIFAPALALFRVYRGSWRLATVEDLVRPAMAVLSGSAASYAIAVVFFPIEPPLSLQAIFTIVLLSLILGSRASYRILSQWNSRAAAEGEAVVIYGADFSGTMAVREALTNRALAMKPVGFIDDDPRLHRRVIHGLPVLGSIDTLHDVLRANNVAGVLIASEHLPADTIVQAREICELNGAWLRYFRVDVTPAEQWAIAAGMGSRLPIKKQSSNVTPISRPRPAARP